MTIRGATLIRHGQGEHQVTGMLGGWHDLPLTAVGRAQAGRVADRLATKNLPDDVVIFSSDLRRASETASIVADRLGLELRLEPGLRELNNGRATGMTVAQAESIALPRTEPIADWVPYEGAESWHDMVRRVFACMDRIQSSGASQPILVGHGGSLSAVVRWWLGPSWSSSRMWEFWFDDASYSSLLVNHFGERQVGRLNDSSHLAVQGPESL